MTFYTFIVHAVKFQIIYILQILVDLLNNTEIFLTILTKQY